MNLCEDLIGLSEQDAIETVNKTHPKRRVRVLERDGKEIKGMKDIILDRINLYIANDIVYKVSFF